jgi:hypothetical protein
LIEKQKISELKNLQHFTESDQLECLRLNSNSLTALLSDIFLFSTLFPAALECPEQIVQRIFVTTMQDSDK